MTVEQVVDVLVSMEYEIRVWELRVWGRVIARNSMGDERGDGYYGDREVLGIAAVADLLVIYI